MTQSTRTMAAQELQLFKAAFFKALAHPIRIRILERLVGQDHTVQELQEALQLSQPVVSQQLAVLRAHNVVSGAKSGTTVSYAVRDPLIGDLLDVARRIFNNHLVGTQGLLKTLQRERRGGSAGSARSDTGRHGSHQSSRARRLTRRQPSLRQHSTGKVRSHADFPAVSPARIGDTHAVLAPRRGRWRGTRYAKRPGRRFAMLVLKDLIVPVDFESASDCALEYARELAGVIGARQHRLHVQEDVSPLRATDGQLSAGPITEAEIPERLEPAADQRRASSRGR